MNYILYLVLNKILQIAITISPKMNSIQEMANNWTLCHQINKMLICCFIPVTKKELLNISLFQRPLDTLYVAGYSLNHPLATCFFYFRTIWYKQHCTVMRKNAPFAKQFELWAHFQIIKHNKHKKKSYHIRVWNNYTTNDQSLHTQKWIPFIFVAIKILLLFFAMQ